jgi:hypothetical protein
LKAALVSVPGKFSSLSRPRGAPMLSVDLVVM